MEIRGNSSPVEQAQGVAHSEQKLAVKSATLGNISNISKVSSNALAEMGDSLKKSPGGSVSDVVAAHKNITYGPSEAAHENASYGPSENASYGPSEAAHENASYGPSENASYGPSEAAHENASYGPSENASYGPSEAAHENASYGPSENASYGPSEAAHENASYGPSENASYGSSESAPNTHENISYGSNSNISYGSSSNVSASHENISYGSVSDVSPKLSLDVVPIKSSSIQNVSTSGASLSPQQLATIPKNIKDVQPLLSGGKGTTLEFKDLTGGLHEVMDRQKYHETVNHLTAEAPHYFDEIAKNQRSLLVNTPGGEQLLIKKSGKVYMRVSTLGKGAFKTTDKHILIASSVASHVASKEVITRSFSAPTAKAAAVSDTEKEENKREIALNQFIKSTAKTADMGHVNVVKSVSSIGGDAQGIMAEVFDSDVDKRIRTKKLSQDEAYNVGFQMTEGVKQLHNAGIVHRDIKPDNFLIRDTPKGLEVKVTDFGKSSGPGEHKLETREFFQMISDPLWAGKEADNDAYFSKSSDVYQLGVNLCLTLTNTSLGEATDSVKKDMRQQNITRINNWKQNPQNWSMMNKVDGDGKPLLDPETKAFLLRMVSPRDASQRPSIEEVSDFFKKKGKIGQ